MQRLPGGVDYAFEKMQALRQEAEQLLDAYPASAMVDAFKQIFNYVIARNK